jgi:Xaa-Pro aminopeptidase
VAYSEYFYLTDRQRSGAILTYDPEEGWSEFALDDPEIRRRYRDTVAWNRVDKLRGFGGIRIEDNVLILDGGNEVLTRVI